MPQSQLKRLKASLREQGIVGPQKSKKQKAKGLSTEQKIRRNAALESIRESLNPFEVKHLARPAKKDITTASSLGGVVKNGALGRPGVSKSLGEQKRRQTLLLEVQKRSKVGGIVDRRIGEDDASMTADERALQRYTWEKQRKARKSKSAFNLEDDDDDGEDLLTHGGQALEYNGDYDAASIEGSDDDVKSMSRKRVREEIDLLEQQIDTDEPERKKSRTEVMEEVIKKSKLYKFERQRAKEEDDDIRIELDKDLSDVRAALFAFEQAVQKPKEAIVAATPSSAPSVLHPDRAALMDDGPISSDKTYDQELRKIASDKRAKPTDRTKSEEEIALEAAERRQDLDAQRLKRMAGLSEDESDREQGAKVLPENIFEPEEIDDAKEFGFTAGPTKYRHSRPEGVDDEDDFLLEDDFIAPDSASEEEMESGAEDYESDGDDSEDDLLRDAVGAQTSSSSSTCPRTVEELEAILGTKDCTQYHETIRQIRLQHDPAGHVTNNAKLADLSAALVQYLAVLPNKDSSVPRETLDVLIRHIHSMARKSPDPVSNAIRHQLSQMHSSKSMTAGDLVLLAAVSAIYPTSDHFHPIVTPAITLMARWLGTNTAVSKQHSTTGAFLVALCLKYQSLCKRYVPEAARFTIAAISSGHKTSRAFHVANLTHMASLWSDKSAFIEIFTPALAALQISKSTSKSALTNLQIQLSHATLARRPLQLHNHRPLAIKTAVPRFEEGFDPAKRYDPDPARAETQRLKREYKKERKGAMRELRKDANFLAREKLRDKKERDRAYEVKYRRLVAEIQGEEGREGKMYEREKMARRGKR